MTRKATPKKRAAAEKPANKDNATRKRASAQQREVWISGKTGQPVTVVK